MDLTFRMLQHTSKRKVKDCYLITEKNKKTRLKSGKKT